MANSVHEIQSILINYSRDCILEFLHAFDGKLISMLYYTIPFILIQVTLTPATVQDCKRVGYEPVDDTPKLGCMEYNALCV